jgi:lysozyme family protein
MISKALFDTKIVPTTLKHEGGYSNVKGDNGGETYRGISRKYNSDWSGWTYIDKIKYPNNYVEQVHDIPHNKIFPELEQSVKDLYYSKYFQNYNLHYLNSTKTGLVLFDFIVHGGFSIRTFQRLLNDVYNTSIPLSGRMDTNTLSSINKIGERVIEPVLQWRKNHLNELARNPSQAKFKTGWINRVNSFMPLAKIKENPIKTGLFFLLIIAATIILFILRKRRNKHES